MPNKYQRFNEPIPPDSVCARCGCKDRPLQRYRLTGNRDSAKYPIICDECVKNMAAVAASEVDAPPPPCVMSEAEKRREDRRQAAFYRLGTDNPKCAGCGENDRRCMEAHHLAGEDFSEIEIRLCRNCHRKLSDSQKDHQPKSDDLPAFVQTIVHILEGLADLFEELAPKLRELAHQLYEWVKGQVQKGAASA